MLPSSLILNYALRTKEMDQGAGNSMFGSGKLHRPPPAGVGAIDMGAEPVKAGAGDAKVWETEADADIASQLRFSGPILSQDEIDSLLGFAQGEEAPIWHSGAHTPYERLPMLEIVFDRLVRLMTTSLRNFMSSNVEVSVEQTDSVAFGDHPDSVPPPAIVAVFRAGQIDNFGLITVDDNLIHSVVDALLGARRGGAPKREDGGPYTAIQRTLVTRMIEVVLADARQAFSTLTEADFRLSRIETDPRFAAIAGPPEAAIVVKLRIDVEDRGGRLALVLPHGALAAIRKTPPRQTMSEGRDNIWEGQLASELWAARLDVCAVLDDFQRPLRKLLDLKVGDTLMLDALPDAGVKLKCGGVDLGVGRVGRMGHSLAVCVERPIAPAAQHAVMKLGGGS